MKHYFPIPYARDPDDGRIGQLSGWLANYGWRMDGLTVEFDRLHWPAPRYQVVLDGRYAGVLARLHVESGAVLVYDDEERTLGVTHRQPEPKPEDEIPARWREPEDARPDTREVGRLLRKAAKTVLGSMKPDIGESERDLARDVAVARGFAALAQQIDPQDAASAFAQEPEDAVPAGFVDRNADMSLIRDRSFDAAWWWPFGLRKGEQ